MTVALICLSVAAVIIAAVVSLKLELWGPSQAVLERRYATSASRFIDLAGTRLHYTDQGQPDGPAVVLLPAQWASFNLWKGWLPFLTDRYRVLCVDLPGHGLTGPMAMGDYSMEAYEHLLRLFVTSIELDRFFLVGSSFSGVIAFRYAAKPGHRLQGLVLACSSGMPRAANAPQKPNEPPPQFLYRALMPYYRLRGFMSWKLSTLIIDPARITPGLIDEFTDFNNRKGRLREAQLRSAAYSIGDPKAVLARIQVPTLIQWPTGSTYLSTHEADLFEEWLGSTVKHKIIYPNTGHLLALDAPTKTGQDARRFFDMCLAMPGNGGHPTLAFGANDLAQR